MIGRFSWQIKLGVMFLISGLIIIVVGGEYIDIYGWDISFVEFIVYAAVRIIGIVLIVLGITHLELGVVDFYRNPLQQPKHPFPPQAYHPLLTQPQLQVRFCMDCKRQIPIDSIFCPYCGVKQASNVSPP